MKDEHEQAVHRRRRILFNNDGDDALYHAREPTPQGMLEVRTTPVLGTHVDTISYCTVLPFGAFQHNTQIGEVFTKDVGGKRNITRHLIEQGTDPLAVMADCCKKNGIELFSSFRMNDVHDAAGYPVFLPRFKKQHPEYLFGSSDSEPHYGYWSGVDYGRPEIRSKALLFITDICTRYDIDGIELDFYRHPPFFKRHAWGKPVLKKELDGMTDLLRQVRKMTKTLEKEHQKPYLVAVRILESVELSRDYGLDVLTWLREHLIDLIITGEVALAPWEDLINLGHQYGVPVYPCLRRTMWYDDPEYTSIASFRAQALSAWRLGADGVYLFNLFPEEGWTDAFRELGDPEA